jgi:choline dehydrogenase-like flavoprotein
VDEVISENRRAGGVRGVWQGRPFEVEADVVVLAAGGIGTPLILQRSGLHEAGRGLAMDTTTMVYGALRERGSGNEPPMTWGYADDERGYLLSTLIDPWLLYPVITGLKGVRYPLTWPRYNRTLGVMIKIKDDVSGGLTSERQISKPLSDADRARLDHAFGLAQRILVRAGAEPASIFMTPLRGTHPSATVRLGEMLDRNLQTEIESLYVCDASVFPEALDRPTVLTILAMGRQLAAHLVGDRRLEMRHLPLAARRNESPQSPISNL